MVHKQLNFASASYEKKAYSVRVRVWFGLMNRRRADDRRAKRTRTQRKNERTTVVSSRTLALLSDGHTAHEHDQDQAQDGANAHMCARAGRLRLPIMDVFGRIEGVRISAESLISSYLNAIT